MPDGAAAPRTGDAAADGGGGGPGHAAAAAAGVTLLSSVGEMVAARERLPAGTRVGLVATMGALHGGHLELVRRSLADTDVTIVTIYVNPLQFSATEDLGTYPRTVDADVGLLTPLLAPPPDARSPPPPPPPHLIFTPTVAEMRPAGASTTVTTAVGAAAANAASEGASRPHFFSGVATVVAALWHLTRPAVAFFGEKDAQQLAVVTAVARDLHFATTVVGVPTVREADGVAASSRNVYLTPEGRAAAPALYRSLVAARDAWAGGGETAAAALRRTVRGGVEAGTAAAGGRVLYVSVADRWSMAEVDGAVRSAADVRATAPGGEVVVCVAVQLGAARLIDNIVLR